MLQFLRELAEILMYILGVSDLNLENAEATHR